MNLCKLHAQFCAYKHKAVANKTCKQASIVRKLPFRFNCSPSIEYNDYNAELFG